LDGAALKKASFAREVAGFLWSYQLPIGLSLTLPALADLCFIIPNVTGAEANWWSFYVVMPQWSFMVPVLFGASLVGIIILCVYSINGIQPQKVDNKEHVAVLLVALGFTYQVIGSWPLWNIAYPWLWQQEIAKYGNILVLPLFAVNLLALITGGASLYIHSRIWHQKHAEIQDAF
jgi:type III secretory pathway component EscS